MRIELAEPLRSTTVLCVALGAEMLGAPPDRIRGLTTDSREVRAGDLFVALQGRKESGARYVSQALDAGACGVLIDTAESAGELPFCLRVADTEQALLDAAAWYRRRCDALVVAVTGSAGKTTVKEAIAAVLGDIPHSVGNYNSTVGLPLSVLSLPMAKIWVLELGINHKGEMRKMAASIAPDIGVLTNVGTAHIGNFSTFSELLNEKTALAAHLRPGGFFLMPEEIPGAFARLPRRQVLAVGAHGDIRAENIVSDACGVRCDLRYRDRVITNLTWPIPGRVGLSVICLAGGVALLLGRGPEQIRAALLRAGEVTPRMRQYRLGERLLLDDTYNASPESVVAALEVLTALSQGRPRVAVLGDMRELGEHSPALHDAVGAYVHSVGCERLFTYGEEAAYIASGAIRKGYAKDRARHFASGTQAALIKALLQEAPENAVILCKGSRACAMERIIESLRRSYEG